MVQNWGTNPKWSFAAVSSVLFCYLKKAVKKTIASRNKYFPEGISIRFGTTNEEIRKLLESPRAQKIRIKALKFQKANRISGTGLINLVSGLNGLFNKPSNDVIVILDESEEEAAEVITK